MGIGNNDVNETNSAELLNEKDVEVREDILTSLMAMNPDDADDDEIANCQTAEHPLVNKLYNLLMQSTEGGSEEEFQIFLSDYPLHIAVATHNVSEIERLILDQPDVMNVNKQAPEKYACATPLMWASAVGAFWCNNIILSLPVAVEMNQTDTEGHTALDYLVRSWWNITYDDIAIFQLTLKLLSLNLVLEGSDAMKGNTKKYPFKLVFPFKFIFVQ